jgi:hypothetical protein
VFDELPDPRMPTSVGSNTDSTDSREDFAKSANAKCPDIEAERAFLKNKMELVRGDPKLSDQQKSDYINQLQDRLGSLK